MDNSGIPTNRQYPQELVADVDLDKYRKLAEIKSDIENFVDVGSNIFICSQYTGNGKTSWALKLLLKYFDSVWAGNGFKVRGLFVNVPTLLLQLKNFSNPLSEEYKKQLMEVDLVVWDEIGVKSLTSYEHENLLSLINTRLDKNQSNIYTSNIFGQELLDRVGERLYSRIVNLSDNIELKGKDKRGI